MGFNLPLHPFQIGEHLGCALITEVAIFLQSFFDDCLYADRKVGIQASSGNGIMFKNRAKDHRGAFAAKRQNAGGHLVEQYAKRKQIGARVQFPRTGLFRRHIRNCAER